MKKISNEWTGIPCPVKKCRPTITHNFTFRIETLEQRKELEELLMTDQTITGLSYDCKSIEREVILIREIK